MSRKQDVNVKAELTAAELTDVQKRLVVLTQRNEFPVEFKALGLGQQSPARSPI